MSLSDYKHTLIIFRPIFIGIKHCNYRTKQTEQTGDAEIIN